MRKGYNPFPDVFSKFATKDDDEKAIVRREALPLNGYRTDFERDYTRILHSRAFRRMRHKTQVFIRPENDHICTRLEHSLYVASIAKTIAKQLRLNVDLVQAIALGHDVGHSPFGHEGERYLDELGEPHGINFKHELHSLRVLDELDSPYPKHNGLNLTFAVRDGIVCHNGESFERILRPDTNKVPRQLEEMKRIGPLPATMEGCVVRFSDKIAYLGRDLEDAIDVKIIENSEIPDIIKNRIGLTNRKIIDVLIRDLVESSKDKDYIAFSYKIFKALESCVKFNYDRIYKHEWVTHSFPQIKEAMKSLFEQFADLVNQAQRQGNLKIIKNKKVKSYDVLSLFLEKDIRNWEDHLPERLAIDFIAGMTDNFFIDTYKELFLPRSMV